MKKSLYTKFVVIVSLLTVFPFITFAQTPIGSNVNVNPVVQQTRNLKGLVALFTEYLNIAIGLIIALSVVTFIWHVYLYFFTEKEKTEAAKTSKGSELLSREYDPISPFYAQSQ